MVSEVISVGDRVIKSSTVTVTPRMVGTVKEIYPHPTPGSETAHVVWVDDFWSVVDVRQLRRVASTRSTSAG